MITLTSLCSTGVITFLFTIFAISQMRKPHNTNEKTVTIIFDPLMPKHDRERSYGQQVFMSELQHGGWATGMVVRVWGGAVKVVKGRRLVAPVHRASVMKGHEEVQTFIEVDAWAAYEQAVRAAQTRIKSEFPHANPQTRFDLKGYGYVVVEKLTYPR